MDGEQLAAGPALPELLPGAQHVASDLTLQPFSTIHSALWTESDRRQGLPFLSFFQVRSMWRLT